MRSYFADNFIHHGKHHTRCVCAVYNKNVLVPQNNISIPSAVPDDILEFCKDSQKIPMRIRNCWKLLGLWFNPPIDEKLNSK